MIQGVPDEATRNRPAVDNPVELLSFPQVAS